MWADRRVAFAAFVGAVALQVLIVALVPVRRIMTLRDGMPVTLRVEPVDPYSVLSGYYVSLAFDVSNSEKYPKLDPELEAGEPVHAVIEKGADGVFKPVRLSRERPAGLGPGQLFLAGTAGDWRTAPMDFGISQFYIPEARRDEVGGALNEEFWRAVPQGRTTTATAALHGPMDDEPTSEGMPVQRFPRRERRENPQVFVDARVDAEGNAALEALRIRDRVYKAE